MRFWIGAHSTLGGHMMMVQVTYLIERRHIPWDTRILDLARKWRCKFCPSPP